VIVVSLVLAVALLMLVGGNTPGLSRLQLGRTAASLDGVAITTAAAVAGLCTVRWKLVGEAAALYLGLASAVYAGLVLGPGLLWGELWGSASGPGLWPATGRLVVAVLVVLALTGPEVDAGVRPWRAARWTAASCALAALVAALLPWIADLFLTPGEQLANGATVSAATGAGAAALWLLLGGLAVWTGHRRHRPIFAWFGLGLVVLAISVVAPLWRASDGTAIDTGTVVLQVIAFLCVGTGTINEFIRAFQDEAGRLLASVMSARVAEERLRVDLEAQRERAHDAQNVLAAIVGATFALERYRDQLDADERAALSSSITSEAQRLQRLVEGPNEATEVGRFRPSDAIASLVTCIGTKVTVDHVDVPSHLVAVGRAADTIQVIHDVLEHAQRHGGGNIAIRATLERDRVVIRVSDGGPGIAPGEEEAIFDRGANGSASIGTDGTGLGLAVGRDLMRRQNGELRLATPDGTSGAAFEIVLPGFSSLLLDQPEQIEDLRQGSLGRRRLRLVRAAATHQRVADRLEEDDPVGGAVAT
jgi:signal transduction histidine kinase